jgi:glycine/D-amino acid oxidase-like deaminating enzyme
VLPSRPNDPTSTEAESLMSPVSLTDPRSLSFWWRTLPGPVTPREPLSGDTDADVVIVGAGYTGLWTAYYLLVNQPDLRVAVVEKELAGYGASGRNGGWCSSLFPATWEKIARESSRSEAVRLQRAMFGTVDEVGRVVAEEGLDVDWANGGTVILARSEVQLARAKSATEHARSWGFGEEDYRFLSADEARTRADATDVVGGFYTPHTAAIHPAKLVRQLAEVVERRGATVYEHTPALSLEPGLVRTPRGSIRAPYVIRATEGYTPSLPGYRREVVPVYSLMLATDPLPEAAWKRIGLAERETFSDFRNMIIYGQRTADDRFAFGGRGAPYHFASRVDPEFDRDERVFAWLQRTLTELFPEVADTPVTMTWGGPLGIARDWWATVGLDPATGIGWGGGYVGDGVGTSHLAGQTLADLVLGRATDLTTLPWVNRRSRRWEPEPLRWLGVNVGLTAMGAADPEESRTGRASVIARTFERLIHG